MSRVFVEKILVIIIGSYLSYYVAVLLMEKAELLENPNYNRELKANIERKLNIVLNLSYHEESLLSCLVTKDKMKTGFSEIVGLEKTKRMIKSVLIKPLKNPVKDNDLLKPPNGIILYGEPGTGKTMLAKAIAKESNCNFLNFNTSLIENKLVGESSKMLDALFSLAHKLKPCIVFMDEIDGFCSERNSLDQSFVNSLKTQMLEYLDGIDEKDSQVIFIGATNRLHSIDKAFRRRLRLHINIPLPEKEDIEQLLLKHVSTLNPTELESISEQCSGFSGSDIYELCKLAAHEAHMMESMDISEDCFTEAIKHLKY